MDNPKVLQERDAIEICNYFLNYCESHITSTVTLSEHYVRPFHTFLPTLLVYIFGSPGTRGWIQTETKNDQDEAIKSLLSVNGHFFQALVKLSVYPEYSYDLVTESLPFDVREILSTGAIHLLPRVYQNCSYLDASKTVSSVNIRTTATRQSTLLPTTVGGDRKIRFNMLQFYLYYFASVPTWPPLVPTPLPHQPTSSGTSYTRGATAVVATTNTNTNTLLPSRQVEYGTIRNTTGSTISNNTTTANSTSPNLPPGITRTIILSVYGDVFEDYFTRFVPISVYNEFPQIVQTFFLDACIELWIRTSWVNSGQKLSMEQMHFITKFVRNVVRHDLKQCLSNEKSIYYSVYASVKDELFFMLSRLALNWSKSDDYLQVMELWAIWAAPWRLGAEPHTLEKEEYSPITHGWALFILDNIPFYYSIVDIILQRANTFEYKDVIQQAGPVSSFTDTGSIRGQLRILYRLINALKARGLLDFLGHVERGLESFHSNAINIIAANANNPFKQISTLCHGTDAWDGRVQEKLHKVYKLFVELDGGFGNTWKTKGLYATEPRSEHLLKALNVLHYAALARQSATNSAKSTQLKSTYDLLAATFKVTGTAHLSVSNNNATTTATTANPVTTANTTIKHRKYQPKMVGLGEGGFLTLEEKLAIRDGKAVCSRDNIYAMGPRAKTYVRSYEDPQLVRWSLQLDAELNNYYNRYLPPQYRPKFLPDALTTRTLARRIHFGYAIVFSLVMVFVLYKIYLLLFYYL
ncbi:hypothetical protein BD408DRAFT_446441 [Parasitella parasitica]|nr:hypothetical protein BD408DRAFT_446441 [Parasitella parasitica]